MHDILDYVNLNDPTANDVLLTNCDNGPRKWTAASLNFGVTSFGDTKEEALENLKTLIKYSNRSKRLNTLTLDLFNSGIHTVFENFPQFTIRVIELDTEKVLHGYYGYLQYCPLYNHERLNFGVVIFEFELRDEPLSEETLRLFIEERVGSSGYDEFKDYFDNPVDINKKFVRSKVVVLNDFSRINKAYKTSDLHKFTVDGIVTRISDLKSYAEIQHFMNTRANSIFISKLSIIKYADIDIALEKIFNQSVLS